MIEQARQDGAERIGVVGTEVKLDEQKYTLVREDDILGVIA